jgi:hypothetical protein
MCVGYVKICLMMFVFAAVAVGLVACRQGAEHEADEEPLLLLEDDGDTEKVDDLDGPVADNSRCHVCHINYADEALALVHARADISCEQCHGPSDAHCSDEDNITPPDIMYPTAEINPSCKGCHPDGKLGGRKKYCTECHGEHRLEHRTRRWDKATGVLIEDDKVRMLTDEMPDEN